MTVATLVTTQNDVIIYNVEIDLSLVMYKLVFGRKVEEFIFCVLKILLQEPMELEYSAFICNLMGEE